MEAMLNECEANREVWGPAALEHRRERTREHLASIASRRESWIKRNRYYYELLSRLLRFLVEPEKKVLSVRCGTGNLLTAVRPSNGKGIDICAEIVEIAQKRNTSLNFAVAFPDKDEFREVFSPEKSFDYILFNDIDDTVDVLQALRNPRPLCRRHLRRMPQLGGQTEIIFCDDQSTDGTAEEVLRVASHYPERHIRLEHGPGICKSKNVWTGFNAATGDILT